MRQNTPKLLSVSSVSIQLLHTFSLITNRHTSLGRTCTYAPISPTHSRASSEVSVLNRPQQPKFNIPSLFSPVNFLHAEIHHEITYQLSRAVEDISGLRAVAKAYFSGIHCWLPIVPENRFYECLPTIFSSPRAEQGLLCLSMALVTLLPPAKDDPTAKEKFDTLYTLLKTFIGMLEAMNIISLVVVQARLLVTLFEIGHGIDAAYISIAALARAAASLGINDTVNAPTSPKSEEELRVWWGVVMLDRYVT